MNRAEAALAECDRLIELCAAVDPSLSTIAMWRIGRDVLTRHTPYEIRGKQKCGYCESPHYWPCPEARPWLALLIPEADA